MVCNRQYFKSTVTNYGDHCRSSNLSAFRVHTSNPDINNEQTWELLLIARGTIVVHHLRISREKTVCKRDAYNGTVVK